MNVILNFLFGKKSPCCNRRSKMYRGCYSRGYNTLSNQEARAAGYYCALCKKITWDLTDMQYMQTLPSWIHIYGVKNNNQID